MTHFSWFLNQQKSLMSVFGVKPFCSINSVELKDSLINLLGEANEALQLLANHTKEWKVKSDTQTSEELKEELVDVLFLLLQAYNQLDMNENDIRSIYTYKYGYNLWRWIDRKVSNMFSSNVAKLNYVSISCMNEISVVDESLYSRLNQTYRENEEKSLPYKSPFCNLFFPMVKEFVKQKGYDDVLSMKITSLIIKKIKDS